MWQRLETFYKIFIVQHNKNNTKVFIFSVEPMDKLIEKACNPSATKRFTDEEYNALLTGLQNSPGVYTHAVSSKTPWHQNLGESMTRNVRNLACKNLYGRNDDGRFVDLEIWNFARDDTRKNKSTKKPAILLQQLGPLINSIGRISCGRKVGTCWLVSEKLVITCHHVYMMFVEERKVSENPTLPIKVSFGHFYPEQREKICNVEVDETRRPQIESSRLDYKILHLKEDKTQSLAGRDGLGRLVRNYSVSENLVVIIGYPQGEEMKEETCVVADRLSWPKQLQERKNSAGLYMTNLQRIADYEKWIADEVNTEDWYIANRIMIITIIIFDLNPK